MRTQHGPAAPTSAPPGPASPTVRTTVSPAPGPLTPQRAARNLSGLLSLSVSDRGAIVAAARDVSRCGSRLSQDGTTFQKAAASRRSLLSRLAAMPGRSLLSARMLSALARAWQASAQADQDLAGWAADESHGCSRHSSSDPHLQAATGPDNRATRFKKEFADLWDPIAANDGLPGYQWNQL
jgi:hypothetical protein